MSVLSEIVASVQGRVEKEKKTTPRQDFRPERLEKRSLRAAIENNQNVSVIGELKRASPTSGLIREDFPVSQLAKSMEEGGAVGVSVLTEPDYFNGKLEYLEKVRESVDLPILRKDFIIDKYQLYQTADTGADVVLLISGILGEKLPDFVKTTIELGMEPLVEVWTKEQVKMCENMGKGLVGVNNRNFETMEIDLSRTEHILKNISEELISVSESGIRSRQNVDYVMEAGADAVLVGTAIMKSDNVESKVHNLVHGDSNG